MQTLSIVSSIKNFNKHVLIDRFHFKRETRIKEKLLKHLHFHKMSKFASFNESHLKLHRTSLIPIPIEFDPIKLPKCFLNFSTEPVVHSANGAMTLAIDNILHNDTQHSDT
jgi:hypothetical protein